jgi:transcriptional regulator with XRE-family HTH domain
VDDQRVGRVVRALRRRLSWRQDDLANSADCSQGMVSLIERGHLGRVSLPVLRRVIAALDASLVLEVRWRAGALERLLDEDHAALVAVVVQLLGSCGWDARVEVTYSEYGERGSYDILAWHAPARILLVIEVKTHLPSAEATLRKLDEKTRLAAKVALERFDWQPAAVARLLVMPESSTLRRRVGRHSGVFMRTFPVRGTAVRGWIHRPTGAISGLWFLSLSSRASRIQRRGGRERIRRPKSPPASDGAGG